MSRSVNRLFIYQILFYNDVVDTNIDCIRGVVNHSVRSQSYGVEPYKSEVDLGRSGLFGCCYLRLNIDTVPPSQASHPVSEKVENRLTVFQINCHHHDKPPSQVMTSKQSEPITPYHCILLVMGNRGTSSLDGIHQTVSKRCAGLLPRTTATTTSLASFWSVESEFDSVW